MTTPSRQPSPASLGSLGPSAHFLRQLLDEISGKATPTTVRSTTSSHSGSPSQDNPSVWIGGTDVARDARDKLRAVDEGRAHRRACNEADVCISSSPRPSLPRGMTSSALGSSAYQNIHIGTSITAPARRSFPSISVYDGSNLNLAPPRPPPTLSSLQIPSSRFLTKELSSNDDIAGAKSPLTLSDIDSDISLTPSPTEPSTSATTATETDATTIPDGHVRSGLNSEGSSPGKRNRDLESSPRMLAKRTRTITLPEVQSRTIVRSNTRGALLSVAVDQEDKSVVQDPVFIERASVHPGSDSYVEPGFSSFRPDIASSQGMSPTPTTPIRATALPESMLRDSLSPSPAETPTFARPLHLIDADISIYKNAHGEEWKENSLCLHCFRRHGSFNRILTYGYEVCGSDKMLDGHYWEGSSRDYA